MRFHGIKYGIQVLIQKTVKSEKSFCFLAAVVRAVHADVRQLEEIRMEQNEFCQLNTKREESEDKQKAILRYMEKSTEKGEGAITCMRAGKEGKREGKRRHARDTKLLEDGVRCRFNCFVGR
mmetsp:Transcript_8953/g.17471  ORF Transcript_8953/g.17471 Transcript_8953/m.17471 type:complete len:122 (-) Transcript_8953:539-904(-)